MKYALYLLFMTEMQSLIVKGGLAPDIDLTANTFTYNDSTVFQFICSTNIPAWQCNVEFLIDERTHDDFRYVENTCYHLYGICSPNICACSEGCESFTWNVTVTRDMTKYSYSCVSKMETRGVTYLATITVKRDTNDGFIIFKKTVVPLDIVNQPQMSTTVSSELITDSITSVGIILILFGSVMCILIFSLLAIVCRRICHSKMHTNDLPECQEPNQIASDISYGFEFYNRTNNRQHEERSPDIFYGFDQDLKSQRSSTSIQSTPSVSLEKIQFLPHNTDCSVWLVGTRTDSSA